MPDETKSVPRKDDSPTNFGAQQAYGAWFQAMVALGQEITRFTQNRLQEDMAAWSALAACRSPQEAMELQRRYAAKTVEEYSDEIGRLSQLMMSMSVAAPTARRR